MKPSEYVRHNLHTPCFMQKDFLEHVKYYNKKLIELDKRFIDKEELKEKINNCIDYTKYKYKLGFSKCKERIEFYEEILKLLEE